MKASQPGRSRNRTCLRYPGEPEDRRHSTARRAARGRHDLGRGQERAGRRHLPLAGARGCVGRAVQGAEHVQQLGRDHRRRRDRAGAGDAGARVRARAERRVQPGAAQAGQRPVVAGRRARTGRTARSARCRTGSARAALLDGRHRHASPTCGRATTSSSARARARPPRSTCGPPTSPTWGWRRPRTCRWWWSATSTAAGCSRTCSARSPCCRPADQARIAGFVVNKFRGDPALLAPGLDQLRALTGRPTLRGGAVGGRAVARRRGLALRGHRRGARPACAAARARSGCGWRWCGSRGSRNATDAEALACEPGVAVRYVTEPSRVEGADLVVLPGSKATVADLGWLRRTGLADAVRRARGGRAAGARDLRWLPDARAADRGPGRGRS